MAIDSRAEASEDEPGETRPHKSEPIRAIESPNNVDGCHLEQYVYCMIHTFTYLHYHVIFSTHLGSFSRSRQGPRMQPSTFKCGAAN